MGDGVVDVRFCLPLTQFNRLLGTSATAEDDEDGGVATSLYIHGGRLTASYGPDCTKEEIDIHRDPDLAMIYRVLKNYPNIEDYPDFEFEGDEDSDSDSD